MADANVERKTESDSERLARYERLLFKKGAMLHAPCFKCGYNGPGYFQPRTHACAETHHALYKESAT